MFEKTILRQDRFGSIRFEELAQASHHMPVSTRVVGGLKCLELVSPVII